MAKGFYAAIIGRPAFLRARRRGVALRRKAQWARLLAEAAVRHPAHAAKIVRQALPVVRSKTFKTHEDRVSEFRRRFEMALVYPEWVRRYDTLSAEDRDGIRARIEARTDWPLITVLMPVSDPVLRLLEAAIGSVRKQLYPNWELVLVDDASADPSVRHILEGYAAADPRIRATHRDERGGIARATNAALRLAKGEFVALVEQADIVAEHALYWLAESILAFPDTDLFYSDSDSLDVDGKRSTPLFKTAFDLERQLEQDTVGSLAAYRRSLMEAVGGMRLGYEDSAAYDLTLRTLLASSAERVRHIPAVLYHAHAAASAALPADRISRSARKAVAEFLALKGIVAELLPAPDLPGALRIRYPLPDPAPTVSVIIPTKNFAPLLRQVLTGVLGETDYPRLEVIVADNGSDEEEALTLLKELEAVPRARVVKIPGAFNFSAINNAVARACHGHVLCFLNNDIAMKDRSWLREMVARAVQPGVGAVGAKLYFPSGRIQHAGVVLGLGSTAGHWLSHAPGDFAGPAGELKLAREVTAVTAACMVMRRSIFEEVGGFDAKNLPVEFNDVDLCLRLREGGYRIIWTPFAELIHHESASRRRDAAAGNRDERRREAEYMRSHWSALIDHDPFFSPNLSLRPALGFLAMPPRVVRPWES